MWNLLVDTKTPYDIMNVKIWKILCGGNGIMRIHFRKIGRIMKTAFICLGLTISLVLGVFNQQPPERNQNLDVKTSSVISLGFGTVLCIVTNSSKKEES